MRSIELVPALPDAWRDGPPVRVGPAAEGDRPAWHVLAEEDGRRVRVEVREEWPSLYTDATWWDRWIVIGSGNDVHLVDPGSGRVLTQPLPSYYQSLHPRPACLIVASGTGLMRLGLAGEVEWRNDDVAVDGVVVDSLEHGVISGSAEWDPPGDWRPFRVDLATGRSLPS